MPRLPRFRRFRIKRLNSSSQECSTVHIKSNDFEMLVCVGDTDAFVYDESDVDNFPPLVEVDHAPMLDTSLAVNYQDHKLMPPSALMLYVCLRCAESDISRYSLYIAPQVVRDETVDASPKKEDDPVKAEFLEDHPDVDKFVEGKFKVAELDPFSLKFDKGRKTPEVTDPSKEENKYHGLYYIRLLLLIGDDPRAGELEFRDTEIMDLTDDSTAGFPAYLKLWVSTQESSNSDKAMREETEKDLILFETLPENAIEDNSGSDRDVLEELGKLNDEEYEKIEE